jgi:hypothetical protein
MDVYDIMAELLVEGHGDKVGFLCSWYEKYRKAGISHQKMRRLLVQSGYLPNSLQDVADELERFN